MEPLYNEKYINRHTSAFVAKKIHKPANIYIEPFPIVPETHYIRSLKTPVGKCNPIILDKRKSYKSNKEHKKHNNLFEYYDPQRKGEPYVSRLYTGFDFEKNKDVPMFKPETSWKVTGSSSSVDNTFWSYDHMGILENKTFINPLWYVQKKN